MNKIKSGISIAVLWFSLCLTGLAQSVETTAKSGQEETDQYNYLPYIQVFIDSALVYSPLIRYWEDEMDIQDQEIKRTRKSWTDRLGVEADAKYGTIDNIILNQSAVGANNPYNSSQTMRYNAGLSLKLPLSEFLNKKNSNQIAKLRHEQSALKKEEIEQEVRKSVIVQYNKTQLAQKIMKIAGENKENCFVQLKSAEIIYKKGNMDMTEFGRLNENYLKSQINYETAREDFITSLTLLQEISGIVINPAVQ